jgi:hypothetical protein
MPRWKSPRHGAAAVISLVACLQQRLLDRVRKLHVE